MKRNNLIALIILLILSLNTHAQFIGNFVEDRICTGPEGNYIFLVDEKYMAENNGLFPEPYLEVSYLTIERSTNGGAFEKIHELRPIRSAAELDDLMGEGTSASLISDTLGFNIKDEEALVKMYQSANSKFDRLFLKPVEQLRAMGHAYLDKNVVEGVKYSYRVVRNDNNKTILEGAVIAGSGNKALKEIKLNFNQYSISSIDSLISGGWYSLGIMNRMAFETEFYGKKTFDKDFEKLYKRRIEYASDTIRANIFHKVNPKEVWDVFAVPMDILGNRGIPSDTATIAALTKGRLPYPKNFTAKDTTNAIFLTWEHTTKHAYVSAYLISREIGNNVFAILDTIPLNQNFYMDYAVENGESYKYDLQVLSSPINNLVYKDFPSVKASGTHATQERILPPENIILSHEGPYIKVAWDALDDSNLATYFVYSSLSANPDEYETVGSVSETTYLIDSTDNGDFQHQTRYYGVRSMSYNLKLSQLSNIVSIIPNIVKEVQAPVGLNVRRWEQGNLLSWEAESLSEKFVNTYKIYRRSGPIEPFLMIDSVNRRLEYFDKTALKDLDYEYSISAVSVTGFESPLSVSQVSNKTQNRTIENLPDLAKVSFRNIPPGIEISWLSSENADAKKLIIYRLAANTTENQAYEKIAEVDIKSRRFWDSSALDKITYLYTVATVNAEGVESKTGFNKLIARHVPKE